jgi:hypothetical protein
MRAFDTAAPAQDAKAGDGESAAPAASARALIERISTLRTLRSADTAVRERVQLLLRPDRRIVRALDNLILALIVLSVASVLLEATAGLPAWTKGPRFTSKRSSSSRCSRSSTCCAWPPPRKRATNSRFLRSGGGTGAFRILQD